MRVKITFISESCSFCYLPCTPQKKYYDPHSNQRNERTKEQTEHLELSSFHVIQKRASIILQGVSCNVNNMSFL